MHWKNSIHKQYNSLKFVSLRVFVQQSINSLFRGFHAGSVVKNPHTGDMGLIPDPGRPDTMRSNQAHAPQLLSLGSQAQKQQLLSVLTACAPKQEKPPQQDAHISQLESRSHLPQLEKSPSSDKDPAQPNINLKRNILTLSVANLQKHSQWVTIQFLNFNFSHKESRYL